MKYPDEISDVGVWLNCDAFLQLNRVDEIEFSKKWGVVMAFVIPWERFLDSVSARYSRGFSFFVAGSGDSRV
jgi:hypothetical protein